MCPRELSTVGNVPQQSHWANWQHHESWKAKEPHIARLASRPASLQDRGDMHGAHSEQSAGATLDPWEYGREEATISSPSLSEGNPTNLSWQALSQNSSGLREPIPHRSVLLIGYTVASFLAPVKSIGHFHHNYLSRVCTLLFSLVLRQL